MTDHTGEEHERDREQGERRSERELELLAIIEQFVSAHRAGQEPRLSTYLRRYPDYSDELTAYVSAYLADPGVTDGLENSRVPRLPLSAGAQRALDHLFADSAMVQPAGTLQHVAEHSAPYRATPTLAALAQQRGLAPAKLAAAADLAPEVIAWLDTSCLPREAYPPALVARLSGALGVPRAVVLDALASREVKPPSGSAIAPASADGAPAVRTLLTTHTALSPEQRSRWRALLDTTEC
jgi:hypothetical protein